MDPATERDLVDRLRRGDGDAFDSIYAAFRAPIFGFLARLSGRRDLAEELLQETFVRLAARATSLREDTRLAAWLYTVARNLHVSHARMTALDAARIDRASLEDPARPATPFEEAAAGQTQVALERALAALPAAYREVLLLVAVERMEPAEAAQVVGVSPDTLRQRLSRARTMMKEALAGTPPVRRRAAGESA
ncbi:MAG TPA: sigma-70 family RNA polymerase sigma factor [Kofleriaceae bacterium]|nr:sigma-70 family RNA polymerase sigma factor [Kofleriaceae bacterium]